MGRRRPDDLTGGREGIRSVDSHTSMTLEAAGDSVKDLITDNHILSLPILSSFRDLKVDLCLFILGCHFRCRVVLRMLLLCADAARRTNQKSCRWWTRRSREQTEKR